MINIMDSNLMRKQNRISPKQAILLKKYLHTDDEIKQEIHYFTAGLCRDVNRAASAKTMLKVHNEYSNMFTGIRCFKGTFFTGQR